MELLILGGTRFLGRALIELALARGHQITLFHRGKSNPNLFPEALHLIGDRETDLSLLAGRHWDAVIDTSAYVPRIARLAAQALTSLTDQYTFISTLSVYADSSQIGIDETASVGKLDDETVEQVDGQTYGPLKALCEQEILRTFPDNSLIIRPGLIVGRYDLSDRFTYWPHRLFHGGDVLVPGTPQRKIQFIDVYDLSAWILRLIENGASGIFNADSPAGMHTMGELMDACCQLAQSPVQLTWAADDFLLSEGVDPWMGLPLWMPENDPTQAGFYAFDVSKARLSGLTYRPLSETVRETLDWELSRPPHTWRAGISSQREAELLEKWHRNQDRK